MPRIVHKHPLAIRWFHWLNFPILTVMIWSGLLIYWAYDPYKITLGNTVLLEFFPDWFYKWLGVPFQLAKGQSWHFIFQWLFIINGILYIGYTFLSGEWRLLLPNRHSFKEAWLVVLHDLHICKMAPPQAKYNAAQRIAYSAIMVMGVGSALTGYAIYKPTQLNWLTWLMGGYETARLLHFALTIGYVLFFGIHIAQVILAGWPNFQSMITGFEKKMSLQNHKPLREELTTDQQIRRRTLKAMLGFGLASLVPVGVWQWVKHQPNASGIPAVLRNLLNTNEKIANVYFSPTHLAPTYPVSQAAKTPRINSLEGLHSPMEPASYQLTVEHPGRKPLAVSLDELKKLPKHELVFDFKCVEGWSQIQHWAGVKFADFVAHYGLGTRSGKAPSADDLNDFYKYVGMETPDGGYYVGLDMPSALHPQTLMAFEMNGQPITTPHGAPIRLIIPVKYGVKNLKRIGKIRFADDRPRDYWAERGYDYHLGL